MNQPHTGGTADQDRDDEDRVVSRRVDHPTKAGPGDEAAYRAADPAPDGNAENTAGDVVDETDADTGSTTADAAAEVSGSSGEPSRSE